MPRKSSSITFTKLIMAAVFFLFLLIAIIYFVSGRSARQASYRQQNGAGTADEWSGPENPMEIYGHKTAGIVLDSAEGISGLANAARVFDKRTDSIYFTAAFRVNYFRLKGQVIPALTDAINTYEQNAEHLSARIKDIQPPAAAKSAQQRLVDIVDYAGEAQMQVIRQDLQALLEVTEVHNRKDDALPKDAMIIELSGSYLSRYFKPDQHAVASRAQMAKEYRALRDAFAASIDELSRVEGSADFKSAIQKIAALMIKDIQRLDDLTLAVNTNNIGDFQGLVRAQTGEASPEGMKAQKALFNVIVKDSDLLISARTEHLKQAWDILDNGDDIGLVVPDKMGKKIKKNLEQTL